MLTDQEYRRWAAYCEAASRNLGVPEMFVEDAAQDIIVALWQEGALRRDFVYRRAVEAARRYGRRNRRGVSRETEQIPASYSVSPWAKVDYVLDHVAALHRLTVRQRTNLLNHVSGVTSGNASQVKAYQNRQRLREYVAA